MREHHVGARAHLLAEGAGVGKSGPGRGGAEHPHDNRHGGCPGNPRHLCPLSTRRFGSFLGKQGSAGLTLPGAGISTTTAMLWELVPTAGLVSVILGTASGAQQIGPLAAIGVGSYIALAGLWGSPSTPSRPT
jgi:hypothetical protein